MTVEYCSDNVDIRGDLSINSEDLKEFIKRNDIPSQFFLSRHLSFEYGTYKSLVGNKIIQDINQNEKIIKANLTFSFHKEKVLIDYFIIRPEKFEEFRQFLMKSLNKEEREQTNHFNKEEIDQTIQEKDLEKILIVIKSLGDCSQNQVEFDYAYNLLLKLTYDENSQIKVSAIKSLVKIVEKGYGFNADILKKTIQNCYNSCEENYKHLITQIIDYLNVNYNFNIKI